MLLGVTGGFSRRTLERLHVGGGNRSRESTNGSPESVRDVCAVRHTKRGAFTHGDSKYLMMQRPGWPTLREYRDESPAVRANAQADAQPRIDQLAEGSKLSELRFLCA